MNIHVFSRPEVFIMSPKHKKFVNKCVCAAYAAGNKYVYKNSQPQRNLNCLIEGLVDTVIIFLASIRPLTVSSNLNITEQPEDTSQSLDLQIA